MKEYGGHKKFLNPKGINLTDVWDDVPPVRQRVIGLTTNPGDLVCDPFAGGGVTAVIAEQMGRKWISGDVNDCAPARDRIVSFQNGSHPDWKSPKKIKTAATTASSPNEFRSPMTTL